MVEKYLEIIDTKTAAFTSEVVRLNDLVPRQGGGISSIGIGKFLALNGSGTRDAFVNFDTTGGATLVVEASLGNGSDFHEVEKITDAGVSQITGYPRMRLSLTNVSSGTHSAGIYGDVVREGRFIDLLTDLNLGANLEFSLDAGDGNSYTSGQKWLDLSGNNYDFFLGADGTSSTDDPTFNGTSDGLSASEYFSYDGGDFNQNENTNPAWITNAHKDSSAFSLATWVYRVTDVNNEHPLIGTATGASDVGFLFDYGRGEEGQIAIVVFNGATPALDKRSPMKLKVSAWNFCGVSVDEASGSGFLYLNGSADSFTSTYLSPSASSATKTLSIGGFQGAGVVPSGTRFAGAMGWSKNLTTGDFDNIWSNTRERFGI